MAAQLVDELPEGDDWLYELKLDGYRALLIKDGSEIRLRSRNDKNLATMYPSVVAFATRLNAKQVVLDGEIVAVDKLGRPSFQALQHRGLRSEHQIAFYAFDILHLNGASLLAIPLGKRRAKLPDVIRNSGVLLSEDLPGTASQILSAVRSLGLEGVIAKHRRSAYAPGERTENWVKLKLERSQEFVIGGYRPANSAVDALLVGFYEDEGLHFAGKIRAGFVPNSRREVFRKLHPLRQPNCPFIDLPTPGSSRWGGGVGAAEMKEMVWVQPKLVAQIRFVEWAAEGRLRHGRFLGLRFDKTAKTIRRE